MEPVVIARAPLSISLGEHELGQSARPGPSRRSVLRAAIGYYAYTIVTAGTGEGVQIIRAGCPGPPCRHQEAGFVSEEELAIPEAISRQFNVRDGLTVFLAPQVPLGGGLGLSGSLAVSMIKALAFCSGIDLEPGEVAELASGIASELVKTSAARADPYAASYGGLTSIELGGKRPTVEPVHISPMTRRRLEQSLMLFRSNGHAPGVLSSTERLGSSPGWVVADGRNPYREDGVQPHPENALHTNEASVRIRDALEQGDLPAFGRMLHHLWSAEPRGSDGGRNGWIDRCYQVARERGALGGRGEMGAGYGSLALFCQEEDQPGVTEALAELGMVRWPLRLESAGVEILEAVPRTWSKLMSSTSLLWSLAS